MTSQINYSAISTTYPVAGQDNDSQGFRDNFTAIAAALASAQSEITDLQTKAVTTATLNLTDSNTFTATPTVNNLLGSTIANGLFNEFYGVFFNGGTIPVSANIDLTNGPIQKFTLSGNATLTFTNWPTAGQYGLVRVMLIGDQVSTRTVTLSSSNAGTIRTATGWLGQAFSTTATATAITGFTTATTSFITGTTLTVISTGTTYSGGITSPTVGMTLSGTGVTSGTYITAVNNASFSGTITGTTLTVNTVSAGAISVGMAITGTGVTAGTYISALGTGMGGIGTYTVSASQTVATTTVMSGSSYTLNNSLTVSGVAISGTGNLVTVGSTVNMVVNTPLSFTSTLGSLTTGVYYVLAVISGTTVVVGQANILGGPATTVTNTTGTASITSSANTVTLGTIGLYQVIDAWSVDGGATVFIKLSGTY